MNTAFVESADRLELTGRVREELSDLMEIERYSWDERGTLTLRGRLSGPADALYRAIRTRMERLGFTPFLRHDAAGDELVAMPGVIERRAPRIWLPLVLFLTTIVTVMLTGALNTGVDVFSDPRGIIAGLPFALTLLGILFTHEMGHYVVGRLRHAPVSLPYFIPMPPGISLIGTMGAVIVQREPMEDRRTVLEVGIAGPLAGLVVAIPLLLYGLATSTVGLPPAGGYLQEGNSLLYIAAKLLVPEHEGEAADERLKRPYFGMRRVEWPDDDSVEFHLPHGELIELLRASGFEVEALTEIRPPADASTKYGFVSIEWARQWPCEEVWRVRKRG